MDSEYDNWGGGGAARRWRAKYRAKCSLIERKKNRKESVRSMAHLTRCEGEPKAACNYYGKTYDCHPVRNETINMTNHLKV